MSSEASVESVAVTSPPYEAAAEVKARPLSGVHIGALDGIRGLAIILVLIFHYGQSAKAFGFKSPLLIPTGFGWCGVDLFFVLSGFLITGILYDSRTSEKYFRNFYARRMLRIFPLYYGAFLIVVAFSLLWPSAGVWGTHSPLWVAFYLSNFLMAAKGEAAVGILAHYWSLAIEEHFYLIWPFIVWFGTRRHLMLAACALVLGSLLLRIAAAAADVNPFAVYIVTFTRFDALSIGAICALAVRGPRGVAGVVPAGWAAMLGGGAAVLLLIVGRHTLDHSDVVMRTIGYTLLAITFGGAIVVGLSWRFLNAVFNFAVLRWFGRYSYGMYVWHPIVNVLLYYTSIRAALGIEGSLAGGLYILFSFVLMVLVSLASYHFWEQPFLRLKDRFK
jgi:peptidoglycan/LPS O-acetylase OafA/YrhL